MKCAAIDYLVDFRSVVGAVPAPTAVAAAEAVGNLVVCFSEVLESLDCRVCSRCVVCVNLRELTGKIIDGVANGFI